MQPLYYPPLAVYHKNIDIMLITSRSCAEGYVQTPDPLLYPTRMFYATYSDISTYNIRPVLVPKNSDLFHLILLRTLQNPNTAHLLHFLAPLDAAVLPMDLLFCFHLTPEKQTFWNDIILGIPPRIPVGESARDLGEFKNLLRKLNLI